VAKLIRLANIKTGANNVSFDSFRDI